MATIIDIWGVWEIEATLLYWALLPFALLVAVLGWLIGKIKAKPFRLALILGFVGILAAAGAVGEDIHVLDVLIGFGVWFAIGYGVGVLIWGRSTKAKDRAKIGGRSASSYVSEIPKAASLTEQLQQLAELRSSRKISEADYKSAKAEMIGPAAVARPAESHVQAGNEPARAEPPAPSATSQRAPTSPQPTAALQLSQEQIAESLRRLKALHDEGILTDTEYETKRQALADQL